MSCLNANTFSNQCQYDILFDHDNLIPYDSVMGTLRENLQAELDKRNWNPYDLESASGVPQPTIARFLSGHHNEPRGETVRKLAAGLGITEAELRGIAGVDRVKTSFPTVPQKSKEAEPDKQDINDYLIELCNVCDDLIDHQGLFPAECRLWLYKEARALAKKHNLPTMAQLELLLLELAEEKDRH